MKICPFDMKRQYQEFAIQAGICRYLQLQYPKALFLCDLATHMVLTPQQRSRAKAITKQNFAVPDILILEPSNGFTGLALEVKKESPFKKNGQLKKQLVTLQNGQSYCHLERQAQALDHFRQRGYRAEFVWSLEQAIEVIDAFYYLSTLA